VEHPDDHLLTRPSSQETYAKKLLRAHCHGYPLWIPEPDNNLPDAYRAQGIRIGDLGYVSDSGRFEYLFNILEPAEHEINVDRTPDNFEVLPLNRARAIAITESMHEPDTDICSEKMKKRIISCDDVETTTP
jgi:hypothetical protein